MKRKTKTPYQRLQETGADYADKVDYPYEKEMWHYDKDFQPKLVQRILAAGELGHDVVLKVMDNAIYVYYRTKRPERPYDFQFRDWEAER